MNMKVTHYKRTSVHHSVTSSEESSGDEWTPKKRPCKNSSVRSSERILLRSRRKFHMPDKKAIMDAIPSLPSTPKSVEKLKPRKLVNNFTRVTHRYNYDPVSSDDSELDDFIDDGEDDEDDDDDDSGVSEQKVKTSIKQDEICKLKQRQHTSVLESDSDSDNNQNPGLKQNSIIESDSNDDSTISQSCKAEIVHEQINLEHDACLRSEKVDNFQKSKCSEEQECDSSGSELIIPNSQTKKVKKSKLKHHILVSDSDSDSRSNELEHSKRRTILVEDSDSEESQRLYSSNEDDEKMPSERAQLMAARREARLQLFEQLKAKKRK